MNPISRFMSWLERRDRRRRQINFLMLTIREDSRWFAADPIALELTDRYTRILRDDWHMLRHESANAFRERVLPAFQRDGGAASMVNIAATEKLLQDIGHALEWHSRKFFVGVGTPLEAHMGEVLEAARRMLAEGAA